MQQCFDNVLGC